MDQSPNSYDAAARDPVHGKYGRSRRGLGPCRSSNCSASPSLAFLVSLVAGVAFIVPMFVLGYDLAGTAVLLGATAAGQVAFLAVGYAYVRVRDVPVPVRRPSNATSS